MTWAALDPDGLGTTAAARRHRLASLEDEALAERLVRLALALRETRDGERLARVASLPEAEVWASPFAVRAVAMGVAVGATTRHRELTRKLDWPAWVAGAEEVQDPSHDQWERGVLRTGKYQGFAAEEPFATFDPSHVSKWGPHELMHRAAGFLFRPGLTRWELYLGARLNELVPVVLWYGPEQAMRLDEGPFDRAAAGRHPRARLGDARWLVEPSEELVARARRSAPVFREGLAHFERELSAIDEELTTGRRVRAPHPFLDASSDATAYVAAHFERLRTPAIARVLERVPEHTRCGEPGEYRDRIEQLFDRLLFEPLDRGGPDATRERERRECWDLLLRAASLGEGVEADIEGLLDALDAEAPDAASLRSRLRSALADEEAAVVLADGSGGGEALDQLVEGLRHVAPCSLSWLEGSADRWAEFATHGAIWDRSPLGERWAAWLAKDVAPKAMQDMARFEAAIARARRDDGVERLSVPIDELPASLRGGVLVRSEAFEELRFDHDVVAAHAALSAGESAAPEPTPTTVLVGGWFDAVSAVPLPDAVLDAWRTLPSGAGPAAEFLDRVDHTWRPPDGTWPADAEAWLVELISAGAVGWRVR